MVTLLLMTYPIKMYRETGMLCVRLLCGVSNQAPVPLYPSFSPMPCVASVFMNFYAFLVGALALSGALSDKGSGIAGIGKCKALLGQWSCWVGEEPEKRWLEGRK